MKKKEESNKKTRGGGFSSESKLIESIKYSDTKVPVMEHLLGGSENVSTTKAKVSLEELAKNRGDAMLRYKEKKKTRRYIYLIFTCRQQVQLNIYRNLHMQAFSFRMDMTRMKYESFPNKYGKKTQQMK